MKLRNVPHLIGQGFISFWRNGVMTTAAILILICCMLVLGSFYTVVDNLNHFIDEQMDEIKTINAYVNAKVSEEDVAEIEKKLVDLMNSDGSNIVSYERFTKQQALEEMASKSEDLKQILEKYNETNNPLPETFNIKYKDFDGVQKLLRDLEEIFGADNIKSRVDTYESLKELRSTATMVGFWLMALLLVVAVLVIMNTVKLTVYARRKDIAIMRYIGATSAFVVSPFIVEGIIIGIVSTIISCGLQYYLYTGVIVDIVEDYAAIDLVPAMDYFPIVPLAFLAIGLFAGVVASAVSVKKHLDV
ncbi:MAG: permease-like cell division protein FtsX [Clostridia bacterium]|nr:permease-like cell division protein FtsX [Clostridia bacterium]